MRDNQALRAAVGSLRDIYQEKLRALVEAPSVSMDPARRADVDRCADLAAGYLRELGAEVLRIDTGGLPLVVGRVIRDPAFPTVTVYNHLDVQPADLDGWRSPPF